MFFSDDNPFASWYHSSRVIYVSKADGSYTILDVEIYPKGLQTDYEEISLADRPDPVTMDRTAFVPDPQKVESNYNKKPGLLIIARNASPGMKYTDLKTDGKSCKSLINETLI